jgi:hypothetical protein
MTRSFLTIIGAIAVAVLLAVVLLQLNGLRDDVADARGEANSTLEEVRAVQSDMDELQAAMDALSDELATLPRSGVVPTDSSGLILERMTEIRDQVTELAGRVDDICRNAPIDLC